MSKKLDDVIAALPTEAIHQRGLLIIAPQGAGKTTYCRTHPHWCDSDLVLQDAGLMAPKQTASPIELKRWETHNAHLKKRGLWVLSSAWWTLDQADAVVLPTRDQLEKQLRAKHNARTADWPRTEADTQLRLLREWAAKSRKPAFASVTEACYMMP